MENNKISVSLTTVIIIVVIVIALIVGLASYIIFSSINKDTSLDNKDYTEEVSNPSISNDDTIEESDKSSIDTEKENTIVENTIIEDTDTNNTSDTSTTTITGKTSSQENPLNIGEWGIASKYDSGEYIDLPVKVTKVTRGAAATQRIKDYCNEHTIYSYEDPKEGMEWAVIDYSVDLTNVTERSSGKSIRVYSKIRGTGDNSSIRYNGYTYILTTKDISETYSKEDIGNGAFAVSLPIGCTEYTIAMGESSHTTAYFVGQ